MNRRYLPEGRRMGTDNNSEYINSIKGLENAMLKGEIVEAVAHRCTAEMTLEFDFCDAVGIIRREECSLESDIKDIAVITRVGKPVCFKIMNIIHKEGMKPLVIMSRREAQRECVRNYLRDLIPGDVIPARVTHLEHFGAFVDVGCGVISLLPIDAISVSRISHPGDRFEVGMYIQTVIKCIDHDLRRIYVSHKELLGTWQENASLFRTGQTVTGIVRSIEDYGIFVELTPNLAGLAELRCGVKTGKCASVFIKNIHPERMKIKLVLIDMSDCGVTRNVTDYYINQSSHISNWRYSPDGCTKVIESCFV